MRTVRMFNTAAGPNGTFIAGSLATVDDETAEAWIAGGYAVEVGEPASPAGSASLGAAPEAPGSADAAPEAPAPEAPAPEAPAPEAPVATAPPAPATPAPEAPVATAPPAPATPEPEATVATVPPAAAGPSAPAAGPVIAQLTKAELVVLATERGIDASGTKAELIERLEAAAE